MSPVDIANLALAWLGEERIASLEDENRIAELVQRAFNSAWRAAIEARAWLFATTHIPLDAPQPSYAPDLPVGFVIPTTVSRVLDVYVGRRSVPHRREGGMILTGRWPSVVARVIELVDDPARWPEGFCRAVAARLAADLAAGRSENAGLAQSFEARYQSEVELAARMDAMQSSASQLRFGHPLTRFRR